MPIKPENRDRYPADWPEISARIRKRARNCCEWPGCGIHNYSVGMWVPDLRLGKVWEPLAGVTDDEDDYWLDFAGQGLKWPTLEPLTFSEAKAIAGDFQDGDHQVIVIVCTVAHLDHQPENCKPSNLRLMCQRHHLAYDKPHHITTAYMARMAARRNLELPL